LWIGERHPGIFYSLLLVNLRLLEQAESDAPKEPRQSTEELDQCIRAYIGLTSKRRTKEQTVEVASQSPSDWTGQPFPVGGLMALAVEKPKAFCKIFIAAFMQPPSKRRRPPHQTRLGLKRDRREHPGRPDTTPLRAIGRGKYDDRNKS
jgi:hypothetical protein